MPHDGIPVVFPALEHESPYYPNGPGERDAAVDLVVLGTAREIEKDDRGTRYEIAIEKVLWGSCPHKTITVLERYMEDKERRIFGLARTLFIYDRATLKPVIGPLFPKDELLAIAFSADGSKVAVATGERVFVGRNLRQYDGGMQTMVRVQDLTTGKTLQAFPSPTRWVRTMALSPDGNRLVLLRDDSVVESYQMPKG